MILCKTRPLLITAFSLMDSNLLVDMLWQRCVENFWNLGKWSVPSVHYSTLKEAMQNVFCFCRACCCLGENRDEVNEGISVNGLRLRDFHSLELNAVAICIFMACWAGFVSFTVSLLNAFSNHWILLDDQQITQFLTLPQFVSGNEFVLDKLLNMSNNTCNLRQKISHLETAVCSAGVVAPKATSKLLYSFQEVHMNDMRKQS